MGNVASRDIFANKTGPNAGPGLDTLGKNQGAFRETLGALPPKDVTILDGAISGFEEAALIVDTEGGAAADDLAVISDVITATEKLHPGMLITLRAKDPARVVTVKNSAAANGINTADGNDIVLSATWELTLRLVGGRWYEVPGRASAQAAVAQADAKTALGRTDPATTTARGIGRVATLADMEPGAVVENGPAFLDAATWKVSATPAAGIIPLADGSGTINSWLTGYTKTDQSNVDTSKANVVLQRQSVINGEMATGSTLIPADDTIPQSNEGDQFMSITFTPKSASSKIDVDVVAYVSSNDTVGIWGGLFIDSATSAFAVGVCHMGSQGAVNPFVINTTIDSPGIGSHTIKLRLGSGNSGSGMTFNGSGAARKMGGKFSSTIRIKEYAA